MSPRTFFWRALLAYQLTWILPLWMTTAGVIDWTWPQILAPLWVPALASCAGLMLLDLLHTLRCSVRSLRGALRRKAGAA